MIKSMMKNFDAESFGRFEDTDIEKEKSAELLNWLFLRLQTIIPAMQHSIKSDAHLRAVKSEWMESLVRHNISTIEMIEFGLMGLKDSGAVFLPTAIAFINLCAPTPDKLGLPTCEYAYQEACRLSKPYETKKDWTHECIRHAASEMTSSMLMRLGYEEGLKLFKYHYQKAMMMMINGEPFKEIPKLIRKQKTFCISGTTFDAKSTSKSTQYIDYRCAGGFLDMKEFIKAMKNYA